MSARCTRDPLLAASGNESMPSLLVRARSEFLEMPGLRLTPSQASRLWALDRRTSESILDGLALSGFLLKTREGAYLRASMV